MSGYTLLTGATGLVGQYLTRDLLLDEERLALIIRPSQKLTVEDRLELFLQHWEEELLRPLPRPVCIAGDISQPELGISEEDQDWIANNCTRMFHNAAILEFRGQDRNEEPWKTNYHGTREMLKLCRKLDMRDLHYVSTAYVSGCREGVIHESELDMGQEFRNAYEDSKFLAEQLVRNAEFLNSCTVYRPAVITGDSRTGYTTTYHGLYMYLQLMDMVVKNFGRDEDGVSRAKMRVNMTGEEKRNLVPVDWVSAVMCRLYRTPEAWGGTYQMAPDRPLTAREIRDFAYTYLNCEGVEFCGVDGINEEELTSFEKMLYQQMEIYQSYELTDPIFDTTETKRFTPDLPCPPIDEAMIARFLEFAQEDRWGRKRKRPPKVAFRVSEYLDNLTSDNSSAVGSLSVHEESRRFSIDVTGPGGGQWTLTTQGGQLIERERGIADDAPVVKMNSSDFAKCVEAESISAEALHEAFDPGSLPDSAALDQIRETLFPNFTVIHS